MNTRYVLISVAIAGALSALLSSIPIVSILNCLLCGWLWLGGIFAVWLYRRNSGDMVTPSQGAIIGLLAGLVAAVIGGLLVVIIGAGGTQLSPQTMALLEEQVGEAAEVLTNPRTAIVIGVIFNLIFYPLFGALGGLLGASIFKNRPAL